MFWEQRAGTAWDMDTLLADVAVDARGVFVPVGGVVRGRELVKERHCLMSVWRWSVDALGLGHVYQEAVFFFAVDC